MTEQRTPNKNRFKELCESGQEGLFHHACVRGRELAQRDTDSWKKQKKQTYPVKKREGLTDAEKKKTESQVQSEIINFLKKSKYFFKRISVGAQFMATGQNTGRLVKNEGMKGMSDIMIIHNGKVIFAEIKRPYGGHYTEEQKEFLINVHNNGGIAGIVTSVEELKALIARAYA